MLSISPLYFYIIVAVLVIIVLAVFFSVSKLKRKLRLSRSLRLVLYEVIQPQEALKEAGQSFKDLIAVMEQFYAGISSIQEGGFWSSFSGPVYVSLELALPSVGEETTFYVAVPRKYTRLFEKQTQSVFPHAKLSVKKEDYNIFSPEGYNASAFFSLAGNQSLPIRTYKNLDADPLEVIANSFSKLKTKGEGAAFQIIITPDNGSFFKKVKKLTKDFKATGHLKKGQKGGVLGTAVNFIDEVAFGHSKSKKEKNAPTSFDEEMAKLLEEKSSRIIFKTNMRVVSSANTQEETDAILKEITGAFVQFTEPQGNSFKILPQKGKKNNKLIADFIMRSFNEAHVLYLNTAELTSIYHFPIGMISVPKLKYLKAKESAPPTNLPEEGILLGKSIFRGDEVDVRMKDDDRRRHLYIIGQTGTGKSVFMKNMIRQDILSGKGICFVDPHGDTVEEILGWIPKERVDDVIYFDPSNVSRPIALNMLEYDEAHPEQKTFIVNELLEIFEKLFAGAPEGLGPIFQQYFRNATMLVMEDPASGNTLLDIERVMAEKSFRDYKLSRSKNPVVNAFWRDVADKAGGEASLQNIVPYITSKFDAFLTNEVMRPILVQERSTINFRQVMDEGKILLVNLSKGKLGDLNAYLLGLIIIGKISMAALSRADIINEEKRRDFYLYIDEFQNVITKSISTILSEARKYHLNLTMAHQFIGQVDEDIKRAIFGNVGSMVSFRIGAEDAEVMTKQFMPIFNENDLINVENFNAFIKLLIGGEVSRPFNIKNINPPKGNYTAAEAIKRLSAAKYGRLKEEVDMEIAKKYELRSMNIGKAVSHNS